MANKTFSNEVKGAVFEAQVGYCKGCLNSIHSFHHKLSNSVANRKSYPLFIHSPMNCVGLCLDCHINKDYKYKVTHMEAGVYERWLEKELK